MTRPHAKEERPYVRHLAEKLLYIGRGKRQTPVTRVVLVP